MRLKVGGILGVGCVLSVALAGCGGGGGESNSSSHTYVVTPPASSGVSGLLTIVSPVAIPTSLLTKSGGKIVSHPTGPQKCSYTKTAQGLHGQWADLNGKTVTVKVNGSSRLAPMVCSISRARRSTQRFSHRPKADRRSRCRRPRGSTGERRHLRGPSVGPRARTWRRPKLSAVSVAIADPDGGA